MKTVTIRYKGSDHDLALDFNRKINDVLQRIEIEVNDNNAVFALLAEKIVNPQLSFNENKIENNEILEIKGKDEIKL